VNILVAKEISKSFGGVVALKSLSTYVREGEIVGIIGPNGSGKTTFLNIISGRHKLDSGELLFCGERIDELPTYERYRRGIATTFQDTRPFMSLTVMENLIVGAMFGVNRPNQNEIKEILKITHLEDMSHRLVKSLPFVKRRLTEIGRAISGKPTLLLLDEPLAGLSNEEITEVTDTIIRIRHLGISVIIVEHVIRAVTELADRIVVLNQGQKIAEGRANEVLSDDKVVSVYFGGQE
jgi:ABC-type branched-subunit amino acid transport system ATPase component